MAGCSLSSTAGRLAAPLRGKHSRREDGRFDRLSRRGDRLAGRWLHLEGAFACSSLKQHVLLEQMKVKGALCSKASHLYVAQVNNR